MTPLVRAPRLAEDLGIGELWLKLDTANPTHSFKDRVVAVAAAKAQELGLTHTRLLLDREPRGAVAARAAAEGIEAAVFCPADLEPEKLAPPRSTARRSMRSRARYDDCSRLTIELSFELDWGFVNVGLRSYYAEGSKTLAYEIAEQLGWRLPDVVVSPIASGSLFTKLHQGFGDLLELGLVDGAAPRLFGGQADGCSPVATAFAGLLEVKPVRPGRRSARSLAIGAPADGDLAVETAHWSGGAIHAVSGGRGRRVHGVARGDNRRVRRDRRGRDVRRAAARARTSARTRPSSCSSPATGSRPRVPSPTACSR